MEAHINKFLLHVISKCEEVVELSHHDPPDGSNDNIFASYEIVAALGCLWVFHPIAISH